MSGRNKSIDADVNKQGNAAAMREALLSLYAWAKTVKENPKDKTAIECAEFVEQTAKEAIKKPPRNCDRFADYQSALNRFALVECHSDFTMGKFARWLFATAAEQKGEGK